MCCVCTCVCLWLIFVFFFKQKTAYEMRISDWSSDVCSSDLFGNYLSTWLKSYLVIIAATSSLAPAIASAAQSLPDQLAAALGGNMATSFDSFVSNAINPAQTIHDNMEPWTIDIWLTEYTNPNPITLIVLDRQSVVSDKSVSDRLYFGG